jgi:hypothetical protein
MKKTLKECIINEKYICPHTELSGKLCSACREPDTFLRFKVEWYHFFCLHVHSFKKLSGSEQSHLLTEAIENHINMLKQFPEMKFISGNYQKQMIIEKLEKMC